ncbi:hypothetical protein WJX79_004023 [Trebouxia sp. C0005]
MVPRLDFECRRRTEKYSGQSQLDRKSESGVHLFRCDSPVPVAACLNRVLSAYCAAGTAVQLFQRLSTLGRGRLARVWRGTAKAKQSPPER